jgi:malate dehydrogenase (oxaloacetate-decarboxylating)(NADP+)
VDRRKEALDYHSRRPAGKIAVVPTKPTATQWDLSLAYTPGVAEPCREIHADPSKAAIYTARANLVAVVTNGTAVLGLGNIGPLASKPVMEGKGVLFKRFAGIDVFDIELDCDDPDELVRIVRALEPTVGGINLEDIKAPECFYIEEQLREQMSIPVFHDDQHGTAIITAAAFLNAMDIVGKKPEDVRMVVSGAGAAATACGKLLEAFGLPGTQMIFCDSKGVLHNGRTDMNEAKQTLAVDTDARTLAEAMVGADVFLGVSAGGLVSGEMVRSMAEQPIVFALANPDPEISYPDAKAARDDVIVATGRSDFPNQVNNVLGFPYIFRGALDAGATGVSHAMQVAAARALSALAREDVPDSVRDAYGGKELRFGPDYLIPKPVDHRVLLWVAPAVAEAAEASGVATRPIPDLDAYRAHLASFLGRRREVMGEVVTKARLNPRRIVFPEGHSTRILRACSALVEQGICKPIVLGRPEVIARKAAEAGADLTGVEVIRPSKSEWFDDYCEQYFQMRQRKGVTRRVARKDLRDRNHFGMMMVRSGHADGFVAGLSMHYAETIRPALQIIGLQPGSRVTAGMYMILLRDRTLFFADTTVNIDPDAETLAEIALITAAEVRRFDIEPRVAMISFSNFGSNRHPLALKVAEATRIAKERQPDLIIDGEMQLDSAVDEDHAQEDFPFSAILGDANILVFPGLDSANAAYKLMTQLGGAEAVGPILLGMNHPVNVLPRGATAEEAVNMAAYTVVQALGGSTP